MITADQLAAHAAWGRGGCPVDDPRRIVMRSARLGGADLRDADLHWSDLRGANLRGANLAGANLAGADIRGAKGIASAGPVGRQGRIVYAVDHGGDRVMVRAGCRWDTAAAVIAAIETDYSEEPTARDAYIAAIRWMVAALEAQR